MVAHTRFPAVVRIFARGGAWGEKNVCQLDVANSSVVCAGPLWGRVNAIGGSQATILAFPRANRIIRRKHLSEVVRVFARGSAWAEKIVSQWDAVISNMVFVGLLWDKIDAWF
mmetsp:Transcript_94872/g.192946  ORF Transcript_94872/g.192946 Transcript_94872/m.192946 type:complete len:113 (+) Transcript_94872:129-467(+)